MNMGQVQDVMDIIANGYGSTPTGIDRSIASRVVAYFYDKGWMSPTDVAYLVEAAGGDIRVSEELAAKPSPILTRYEDPMTHEWVFRTRDKSKEDLVKNAKVNPDAEKRDYVRGAEGYVNPNPGPYS